jgi:23S rRNA (guanosine2251-2'-O)-methyltransferase
MGAVFHIPVLHARALPATLTFLHQRFGTSIIASDPHGEATLDRIDFSGNVCIVMGNEDDGISREIMDVASVRVSIPMARNTDSLNVAAASAVFLFAANRFREKGR